MTERRRNFSAVSFADRYILAIGGENEIGQRLASVEIYDSQEERWAPYTSLATARSRHRCLFISQRHLFYIDVLSAVMAGGKIYVLGGDEIKSVECFTPGPPGTEPTWHTVRSTLGCCILIKL